MKNLLKKLVLGILVATTIITAVPVQNVKAEVKPYKKHKQLWVDMDKTTPEKYVSMLYKYGKKGIKEKTHYYIGLKYKAKTYKQAIKKQNAFAKKCMKVKQNKYGLSFGIMYDTANADCTNYGKTYKAEMYDSANDCIYMEQIVDKALAQEYITVEGWDKNGNWTRKTALTKDVFPTVASFKKASDSVKLQVVATYMSNHCMFYEGTPKDGYNGFCFQGAAKGKCYGVCYDFRVMYMHATRTICYDDECRDLNDSATKYARNYPIDFDNLNHALMIAIVRNSKGGFDMFEGNDNCFLPLTYSTKQYNWEGFFANAHKKYPEVWSFEGFYDDYSGKCVTKYLKEKHNSELFNIISAMN